jgi:hypothetical protein
MMGGMTAMISKRRQRGMSIWVLLYILATLGFIGLMGLKLFPLVLESFKIDKALTAVIQDPNVSNQSKGDILESLRKRFDVEDVRTIRFKNMKDHVFVEKKGEKVKINVVYRSESAFFWKILLVLNYDKTFEN